MLTRLFKRKNTPEANLIKRLESQAARPDPMHVEFLWEVHVRALQCSVSTGKFQGCLSDMQGFACQTQDNGMEVAVNRAHQFQAIMAENVIMLSGVDYSAVNWCLAHLGIFIPHALQCEPDWQTSAEGAMICGMPFGNSSILEFNCSDRDDIDFDFSGSTRSGAALIIKRSPRVLQ